MCISQKFLRDLCVGSPRSPDVGFLNAGTLQFTEPLLPLCFDHCLLMKSRCVLSFFVCFGLCVLILSKAHRNLLLHFPSFTSDGFFSITAATLFYDANFESQSLPVVTKVVLWTGKRTAWKRNNFVAPASSPSATSISSLQGNRYSGLSETELSFCFSCHSTL